MVARPSRYSVGQQGSVLSVCTSNPANAVLSSGSNLFPGLQHARDSRRLARASMNQEAFDLVEVGDEAVANDDSVLQAYLFEDRV